MTETKKLYYEDSFLQTFTATVLSCQQEKDRYAVVLDQTAFYPEGGGQEADTGTLGGVRVLDVREKDGEIRHLCDAPLEAGAAVTGAIDWGRRFDHMQQHSGEHIVSGILCARYGCDNVGFHMGHALVTIDFNADIPPEDLADIEAAANAYIWSDAAVRTDFLRGEALERAHYRSKKFSPGVVRLVSFPGADCCACCGTHVRSAGQVGLVKLLTCQKFREGVRIEMAAGGRALRYCNAVLEQNTRVSHLLSAKALDTAAAVERMQKELYALRGRVAALEEGAFARKAAELAGAGDVLLLEGDMGPESVRKLCAAVLDACGGRCVVFAGTEGAYKYAVGEHGGDLRQLTKALNAALNGRGGGKPDFVQGSVAAGEAEIRQFFADLAASAGME